MGSTKDKREELRDILLEICENVYYSPPSGHGKDKGKDGKVLSVDTAKQNTQIINPIL